MLLAGLVLVVIAALAAGWWFLLRDDAPEAASLRERSSEAPSSTAAPTSSIDGEWVVQPDDGTNVFVGYRIDEQFAGESLTKTATGRTAGVGGAMSIVGGELRETTITADMAGLSSDADRRDRFLATNALETATFPEATFTLTDPVELPPDPEDGEIVSVTAIGDLTLRDRTVRVQMALDARWNGSSIDVTGSAPVVLADFGIEPPDVGGFVSVAPEGTLELQVTFVPAA
jgi:polyisoprenoid-binding protein YceI